MNGGLGTPLLDRAAENAARREDAGGRDMCGSISNHYEGETFEEDRSEEIDELQLPLRWSIPATRTPPRIFNVVVVTVQYLGGSMKP